MSCRHDLIRVIAHHPHPHWPWENNRVRIRCDDCDHVRWMDRGLLGLDYKRDPSRKDGWVLIASNGRLEHEIP